MVLRSACSSARVACAAVRLSAFDGSSEKTQSGLRLFSFARNARLPRFSGSGLSGRGGAFYRLPGSPLRGRSPHVSHPRRIRTGDRLRVCPGNFYRGRILRLSFMAEGFAFCRAAAGGTGHRPAGQTSVGVWGERSAEPTATCCRRIEHEIGNHKLEFPISSNSQTSLRIFCRHCLPG